VAYKTLKPSGTFRPAPCIPSSGAGATRKARPVVTRRSKHTPTGIPLAISAISRTRMERLWSLAVTTRGNRWQMALPEKRQKQAEGGNPTQHHEVSMVRDPWTHLRLSLSKATHPLGWAQPSGVPES